MNWVHARERLAAEIHAAYGHVNTETIRRVADRSKVRYTTLARFFLYTGKKRTGQLQRRTLEAVCRVLELRPSWVIDGEGAKQLSFWPSLVPPEPEAARLDIGVEVAKIVEFASQISIEGARARVCRAIVATCIETAVRERISVPVQVYTALLKLDSVLVRQEDEVNQETAAA